MSTISTIEWTETTRHRRHQVAGDRQTRGERGGYGRTEDVDAKVGHGTGVELRTGRATHLTCAADNRRMGSLSRRQSEQVRHFARQQRMLDRSDVPAVAGPQLRDDAVEQGQRGDDRHSIREREP